jgi:long-chain acyl-CoA synthetase
MLGYWNQADETSEVLRNHAAVHDGDGVMRRWLHTGDLGYLDDDGYLFIVDRKKDLIKTSGYQVWPREVEEVLASHPAVAEVGVAGIPDPTKGEVVKAWIVLRAGRTVSEAELRAFSREKLAPYKVPAHVEFRTELPKTMVGKVLRRELRDGG